MIPVKFPKPETAMRLSFILTGLLSLALASCSKPKEEAYSKLLYRHNVYGDPETALPFTGIAKETYPDGKRKAEFPMKNGKFHGTVKEWYQSGKKLAETEFKDGERVGKNTEWTEAGLLYRERVYDHEHIVSEKTYDTGK